LICYTCLRRKVADMKKKLPRRRRKQLLSQAPANFAFWESTVKNEKNMNQFLLRGDTRQKSFIISTLNYIKKIKPLEFILIKGQDWLDKFKESVDDL